jgi:hypothetical protein
MIAMSRLIYSVSGFGQCYDIHNAGLQFSGTVARYVILLDSKTYRKKAFFFITIARLAVINFGCDDWPY